MKNNFSSKWNSKPFSKRFCSCISCNLR